MASSVPATVSALAILAYMSRVMAFFLAGRFEADHLDAGIGFGPLDQNIIGHIHLLQSSHFQSSERDPGGGKAWPSP